MLRDESEQNAHNCEESVEPYEIFDDEYENSVQSVDSDDSLIIFTKEAPYTDILSNKTLKDEQSVEEIGQEKRPPQKNSVKCQSLLENKQKETLGVPSDVSILTPYSVEEIPDSEDSDSEIILENKEIEPPKAYIDRNNILVQSNLGYFVNPEHKAVIKDQMTTKNEFLKYPDRPLPWKKPETLGTSSNPIDLSEDLSGQIYHAPLSYSRNEYQNPMFQGSNISSAYSQVPDTNKEIMALFDNIYSMNESKIREGTPKRLLPTLMEHQKIGLSWMKEREEGTNKGGILADDMGLGKTIQALALIVSQDENKIGTTLICTPVSLLQQWAREIQTKTKPPLKVYIHHGNSKRIIQPSELNKYEIVLTTYGTVARDHNTLIKLQKESDHSKYMLYKPAFTLLEHHWHRIILDEAQVIKNRHTLSAQSCYKLQATYRWCLSGTPMQNSIDELYSLICFLRIKPYDDWSAFSNHFSKHFNRYSSSNDIMKSMKRLQVLLKATLLRRTKASTINGKPLLTLLPKSVELVYIIFSDEEQAFYKKLEAESQLQVTQYVNENILGYHYTNLLVLLLRLRQACDHPWLVKTKDSIEISENDLEDQEKLAREIFSQQVQNIQRLRDFECHVCYEVILSPNFIVPCGHYYCRDCIIRVIDQSQKTSIMNGNTSLDARCPECRCIFNMKKVIDFSVFKKVYGWNYELNFIKEHNKVSDEGDTDDEDLTVIKDKGKQRVVIDNKVTVNDLDVKLAWKRIFNHKFIRQTRNKFQQHLQKNNDQFKSSTKIDKCIEILDKIKHNNSLEKTIVFSQFVEFLDLLEISLLVKGYKILRYDGRMSAIHRDQSVFMFDQDPTHTVMLISLKAGNSGLNLASASQCILLDPFWNPFLEEQAINRIHRIGQTKPVQIYKLVVKGTVEQRVLDLQKRKRDLIENALEENASMQISRLNKQELSFLFGLENT
ncbi:hypothetical protein T552_03276 [Pneumocystis carinii B80]|uniref:Uncharacterized protein n=1 Tax=Pneumocystis carinii (strain B80) TaxID=1408658 RepID=A0A0W4ZCA3_PNEC8|nr:hypothetical protein T552_03276 [Pneumocystis carinii B80]KTW26006.1 hypothetical protein T552_03276 [Pneumocystis carinii B80]